MLFVDNPCCHGNPENKEPFLNQLAHVILVYNWYRPTSICFLVYSCEYTCFACCHKFWTSLTGVVLGQNWYGFTVTCHHVKNSWFHGKYVLAHQFFSQNPVNSHTETRELSQLYSWIHLQNMWNHGSLFAGNQYLAMFLLSPDTGWAADWWEPLRMDHGCVVAGKSAAHWRGSAHSPL